MKLLLLSRIDFYHKKNKQQTMRFLLIYPLYNKPNPSFPFFAPLNSSTNAALRRSVMAVTKQFEKQILQ